MVAGYRRPAHRNFDIPVLVPVTGFLALEGTAQRNGALLALAKPLAGIITTPRVADTSTSPEVAVNALQRALRGTRRPSERPSSALKCWPCCRSRHAPVPADHFRHRQTDRVSGNLIFRFFPGDRVVKTAQARYAVEVLGAKRPALPSNHAHGQSGRAELKKRLAALGAPLVFEEALSPKVKDMAPALTRVAAARPDVILLHSGLSALVVRQAKALGLTQKLAAQRSIN